MVKSHEMNSLWGCVCNSGVTLLHNFKNMSNQWIIFCDIVHRHHAFTLYMK